jgi:hypothetical protein
MEFQFICIFITLLRAVFAKTTTLVSVLLQANSTSNREKVPKPGKMEFKIFWMENTCVTGVTDPINNKDTYITILLLRVLCVCL